VGVGEEEEEEGGGRGAESAGEGGLGEAEARDSFVARVVSAEAKVLQGE